MSLFTPAADLTHIQDVYVKLPTAFTDYYTLSATSQLCQQHSENLLSALDSLRDSRKLSSRHFDLTATLTTKEESRSDHTSNEKEASDISETNSSKNRSPIDNCLPDRNRRSCYFAFVKQTTDNNGVLPHHCDHVLDLADKPHKGLISQLKIVISAKSVEGDPPIGNSIQPFLVIEALELREPLAATCVLSLATSSYESLTTGKTKQL